MITIIQSQATAGSRRIPFIVKAMSNLLPDDATGLTFSAAEIQVSKNGATSANSAGSVVEIGGGVYYYQCTSGEVDTLGFVTIHVVKADYTGQAIVYIAETTVDVVADRVGPWTGDTAKNSVYGALRSMTNADSGFTSADLTKDDGDGAGSYNNEQSSIAGIRSITAIAGLALPDGILLSDNGTSTTVFTLPAADLSSNTISTSDNRYRDNEVVFYGGANDGLTVPISSYTGSSRTVTLPANRPCTATPQAGDVVFIRRASARALTDGAITDDVLGSDAVSKIVAAGDSQRRIYVRSGTQATLSVTPSGSSNNYKLTAWSAGTDGNSVTLTVTDPGSPSASLSVSVSSAAITVSLATNGSSAIITTANELVNAINSNRKAYALVYAEVTDSSGSGVVTALSVTSLSGGAASTGSDSNDGYTRDTPKATMSGAESAAVAGDVIHLMAGVHTRTGGTSLPDYVTIEGEGPEITRLRIGANTVDLFGSLFLKWSDSTIIRDLYVDGIMCGASALYTGSSATGNGRLHLENVHMRARGYGLWAFGGAQSSGAIQRQVVSAKNCRFMSGISAFAFQGAADGSGTNIIRHQAFAESCYFEADDEYYDGSASSDTQGNTYAVLSADSDIYLHNCTMFAKHHHKNRTAYAVQAGSPVDANRSGNVFMSDCRLYAQHTQESSSVRITDVSIASQAVITSAGHGLSNDNMIWIQGVNGTGAITNVNRTCRVSDVTTDTFKVKDPQTGSYISTATGTYVDGGTWDIRPWDVLSKWDGSLVLAEGCAYSPALVETYYGEFQDRIDNIEHKASIVQGSETGHIAYAGNRPFETKTRPRNRGWSARHPFSSIANAVLEATAGTPVYVAAPDAPIDITAAVTLPSKVDIHGHKNKTKIRHTGTGGAETDAFFVVTGNNLIEDVWLDDQSTSGVSGISVPSGAGRLVVDHLVATVDFSGVRVASSTASVATIENSRLVAGTHGVYLAGAVHTGFFVGDHPYVSGATAGIYAAAGSKIKASHAIITSTTDDVYSTGSGTIVYTTESNYDVTNTTTASSGQIQSYEQVADILFSRSSSTACSITATADKPYTLAYVIQAGSEVSISGMTLTVNDPSGNSWTTRTLTLDSAADAITAVT